MVSRRRTFNLLDCIILTAFTAVGFAFWRDGIYELLTARSAARSARFYWYNSVKFSYMLAAWSLALLVLSLRNHAPPLRRLVFCPAFVVGAIVLIDILAKGLGYSVAIGINGGVDVPPLNGAKMFSLIIVPIEVGFAIGVMFLLQIVAFRHRQMTHWLDLAGFAIGLFWIVLGSASYLFRLTAR